MKLTNVDRITIIAVFNAAIRSTVTLTEEDKSYLISIRDELSNRIIEEVSEK